MEKEINSPNKEFKRVIYRVLGIYIILAFFTGFAIFTTSFNLVYLVVILMIASGINDCRKQLEVLDSNEEANEKK